VLDDVRGPDPVIATGASGERRAYAGVLTTGEPDVTPQDLLPAVSALRRARTAADRLPASVVRAAARAARRDGGVAAVASSARYAGSHAGQRHWVMADARRTDSLAVATLSPSGSVSFRDVPLPTRTGPMPFGSQFGNSEAYGPLRGGLLCLVPDGFTEVVVNGRAWPITANLVALHGIPLSATTIVELRGQAGVLRRTFQFSAFNTDAVALPSNRVPNQAAQLLRGAARASRLGKLTSATVAAGTRQQVGAVTGFALRTNVRGRVWVLTGTDGRRTIVLTVTVKPNGDAVVLQQSSLLRPPDQSSLTRVRPLELD